MREIFQFSHFLWQFLCTKIGLCFHIRNHCCYNHYSSPNSNCCLIVSKEATAKSWNWYLGRCHLKMQKLREVKPSEYPERKT